MFLTIIAFLITILLLVIVHELGHFFVAKRFNIKVLEFGFGIPPRAWGKKIGETIYSLNWLPIGGFVRLLGEDEVDKKLLEDHRSFAAQNVWKRIAVVVAGVSMNLILAWILFYIVIIAGNWKIVIPSPSPQIFIEVVAPNSPAEQAGLKKGDRVISINNAPVTDQQKFIESVKQNAGKEINLEIESPEGKISQVTVTPRIEPPAGQGPLGVATTPFAFKEFKTPVEKLFAGPIYSYELTKLVIPGFQSLGSSLVSQEFDKASEQVAGPIGIVVVSNSILQNGLESIIPYTYFVGLISLNLAIINILPFPALDGGRLFFLLVEAITRKRTHPVLEKYVHAIGMALLLGLILLITYSDIKKLL